VREQELQLIVGRLALYRIHCSQFVTVVVIASKFLMWSSLHFCLRKFATPLTKFVPANHDR